MKKLWYAVVTPLLLLPAGMASAQFGNQGANQGPNVDLGNIETTIQSIGRIVNLLIPIFIAIAVIVFFYGIIRYVLATGAEDKDRAKNILVYGLLGIFVMVTLWGIIYFFASIFGLGFGSPAIFTGPQVNPGQGTF